ncbi:MAG TPA: hypothetical protein VFU63_07610 [Ktedonobacterales bacterium]|nr:hypothetical protein [Ktedonobacterales bacterium]
MNPRLSAARSFGGKGRLRGLPSGRMGMGWGKPAQAGFAEARPRLPEPRVDAPGLLADESAPKRCAAKAACAAYDAS